MQVELLLPEWSKQVSTAYKEAAGYTHRIVAIGYGVGFGVWALVRDIVSPTVQALAGLLLIASAVPFALWEVYAMISYTRDLQPLVQATSEAEAVQAMMNYSQSARQTSRKVNGLWLGVVTWCVITGIAGICVLTGSLACVLVRSLWN